MEAWAPRWDLGTLGVGMPSLSGQSTAPLSGQGPWKLRTWGFSSSRKGSPSSLGRRGAVPRTQVQPAKLPVPGVPAHLDHLPHPPGACDHRDLGMCRDGVGDSKVGTLLDTPHHLGPRLQMPWGDVRGSRQFRNQGRLLKEVTLELGLLIFLPRTVSPSTPPSTGLS